MANLAPPTTSSRSAVFNLPSSTNTSSTSSNAGGRVDDDDDDGAPLPFPAALPRSDFLKPDFQPAEYLSSLPFRHQTLDDLRSDLRERSAAISSELLELVNSNYTAFLSLGSELRGGDDKVEDVRVAMLGFRRAVEDVKGKVSVRRDEAASLNDELRDVRGGIERGSKMLELSDRLSTLEERLALGSLPAANGGKGQSDTVVDDIEEEDEDDEDEEDEEDDQSRQHGLLGSSPGKLTISAQQCQHITALISSMDQDHAFVIKQEERLMRCRNTLLLDLGNALKEARKAGVKGRDRVMKYLAVYRIIDAQDDAVKALQKK